MKKAPGHVARSALCWLAFAALAAFAAAPARAQTTPPPAAAKIDAAFAKFFAAASPDDAAKSIAEIEAAGITFDGALARLRRGRVYPAQPSGIVRMSNDNGLVHFYDVNVPANYDPARRYQLRIQLHGGVVGRNTNEPRTNGAIGALAGAEQFYVLPAGWWESPWWGQDAVLNLNAVIDTIKRIYNIDENRVVLSGVSDGGTGTYYIAMRDTTPFAAFLPLNGYIGVLTDKQVDDGRIFPNNLRNKPMFVVNGGKDHLYPLKITQPVVQHLVRNGVTIQEDPQPDSDHNTRWWPQVVGVYEKFVADHPRDPDPDKLTWETTDELNARAHWLIIGDLGPAPGEAKQLPDANTVAKTESLYTQPIIHNGLIFAHQKPWGRVDVSRTGNTIAATTKNVRSFTLLLSPNKFDFSQPVRVLANGREVFNARVDRNLDTLLKWAAQDNDRTMLYAAEIKINLAR